MNDALKGITSSKKFVFGIFAMLIIAFEKKLGLELDLESKTMFVALATSVILGQAAADAGKEKAKVEKEKSENG